MDNEVLKKVAKLGVLARKHGTFKIDFNRLLTEKFYADQLLSELENCNDEELLLLCLSIKVDLGVLPSSDGNKPNKSAPTDSSRYVFSTRG